MPLGRAALNELFDAVDALRDVLGGNDAAAIETSGHRVQAAAAGVRAIGAWHLDEETIGRLKSCVPLIESARIRVKLLSDHVGQRLSVMADRGAPVAPLTYGR